MKGNMYSKFPFSMENLPRQRSFACLSLKFGSIITALIVILYSLLALSQCSSMMISGEGTKQAWTTYGFIIIIIAVHFISFILSAVMLLGALRDKASLVKPWVVWKSILLASSLLMFVLYSTMHFITQFDESSLLVYVSEFLSLLIRFYMLTIVASYHKQMVEDGEETERLRTLMHDTWYTEA